MAKLPVNPLFLQDPQLLRELQGIIDETPPEDIEKRVSELMQVAKDAEDKPDEAATARAGVAEALGISAQELGEFLDGVSEGLTDLAPKLH